MTVLEKRLRKLATGAVYEYGRAKVHVTAASPCGGYFATWYVKGRSFPRTIRLAVDCSWRCPRSLLPYNDLGEVFQ